MDYDTKKIVSIILLFLGVILILGGIYYLIYGYRIYTLYHSAMREYAIRNMFGGVVVLIIGVVLISFFHLKLQNTNNNRKKLSIIEVKNFMKDTSKTILGIILIVIGLLITLFMGTFFIFFGLRLLLYSAFNILYHGFITFFIYPLLIGVVIFISGIILKEPKAKEKLDIITIILGSIFAVTSLISLLSVFWFFSTIGLGIIFYFPLSAVIFLISVFFIFRGIIKKKKTDGNNI